LIEYSKRVFLINKPNRSLLKRLINGIKMLLVIVINCKNVVTAYRRWVLHTKRKSHLTPDKVNLVAHFVPLFAVVVTTNENN